MTAEFAEIREELADAARKIQRRTRGLLGAGDILDKDQLHRLKLLAREFLLVTL
jgi:diphthamide synthase (EF-2-diphthine--ammonia ligase)